MNDIKLLEKCPCCGAHLTLMESINADTNEEWIIKRCLECGQYGWKEVKQLNEKTRI